MFIEKDLSSNVIKFLNNDEELSYKLMLDAYQDYAMEYAKFPPMNHIDSLDDALNDDKRLFYSKYRPFADKCKEILNELRISGYGRGDFSLVKVRELCKDVDMNFPYGWKYI